MNIVMWISNNMEFKIVIFVILMANATVSHQMFIVLDFGLIGLMFPNHPKEPVAWTFAHTKHKLCRWLPVYFGLISPRFELQQQHTVSDRKKRYLYDSNEGISKYCSTSRLIPTRIHFAEALNCRQISEE